VKNVMNGFYAQMDFLHFVKMDLTKKFQKKSNGSKLFLH